MAASRAPPAKYGEHDITGDGALRLFSQLKKVTTKWTTTPNAPRDAANFGGYSIM